MRRVCEGEVIASGQISSREEKKERREGGGGRERRAALGAGTGVFLLLSAGVFSTSVSRQRASGVASVFCRPVRTWTWTEQRYSCEPPEEQLQFLCKLSVVGLTEVAGLRDGATLSAL